MSGIAHDNIFDALPTVSLPGNAAFADELTHYLAALTEATHNPLLWWVEKQAAYPCLSHMARNYLSIPSIQQQQLMLNVFLAKATLLSHMSAIIFLLSQPEHFFVWGLGASLVLSKKLTFMMQLHYQI